MEFIPEVPQLKTLSCAGGCCGYSYAKERGNKEQLPVDDDEPEE